MPLYHIDTDMGVDDGLALVIADHYLREVHSISTVCGNVPVETATRNALIFRELLGRKESWNILQGASCADDGYCGDARHIHGADGLGGATMTLDPRLLQCVSCQAVPLLVDAASPAAGAVSLIGIGPATNVPRLVSWYGRSAIKRIVLMSGAFFDVGNITPSAEFNAHCDPSALQTTLDIGVPVTLVPLDVCRKVQISRGTIINYGQADSSPIAQLVAASHAAYTDVYLEREGIDGCFPHDSIAILAALAPERFFSVRGRVNVDCSSAYRGQTTITLDETSHIEIVTGGELKWVRETLRHLPQHGIIPKNSFLEHPVP